MTRFQRARNLEAPSDDPRMHTALCAPSGCVELLWEAKVVFKTPSGSKRQPESAKKRDIAEWAK